MLVTANFAPVLAPARLSPRTLNPAIYLHWLMAVFMLSAIALGMLMVAKLVWNVMGAGLAQ